MSPREEQYDDVKTRTIKLFDYETLINSYQEDERRRFYDLDLLTIMNDINHTLTNAGEERLLHHFLKGSAVKKHALTVEEDNLIKQIGFNKNLSCYTFLSNDYQFTLPNNKKLLYSLGLLPIGLVLGCFFKLAFFF